MRADRVYLRGCGIVSAAGDSQQAIAQTCRQTKVTPEFIQLPHSCDYPLPFYAVTGEENAVSSERLYQYIDNAVDSAIRDADLSTQEITQLPVFVGSTAGDISDLESHYQHDLAEDENAIPLYRSGFGVLAGYITDRLNSRGQEFTFTTACSSSANAMLTAASMIAHGRFDHALVVGVEARNQMSLQGFNTMLLISREACRPFDKQRDGTVLGEGVGAIVLSRDKPKSSSYCGEQPFYWLGGANLTDSENITSSSAEMIAAVMTHALNNAAVEPDAVTIIKAHGTSTPANDSAEAGAMQQIFNTQLPPFTSLKPFLGHTLGACGVMETITLLACAKQGFIPPTPGFSTIDEACGCAPLTDALPFDIGTVMLNYFGFGGNNSSLLISNRP